MNTNKTTVFFLIIADSFLDDLDRTHTGDWPLCCVLRHTHTGDWPLCCVLRHRTPWRDKRGNRESALYFPFFCAAQSRAWFCVAFFLLWDVETVPGPAQGTVLLFSCKSFLPVPFIYFILIYINGIIEFCLVGAVTFFHG